MFMIFNAIFLAVFGVASATAITAGKARDESARTECATQGPQGSAAYTDCLKRRGVTVELQQARTR